MEKSGIYKITNIITNKVYIGSAVNLNMRKNSHFSKLSLNQHGNKLLQNSYNKYGQVNFIFEIIEYVKDKTKLIEREQFYFDTILYARDFINQKTKLFSKLSYNILPTAGSPLDVKRKYKIKRSSPSWNKGLTKESDIRIKLQSEKVKGIPKSEETIRKISLKLKGRKISEEIILKYKNKIPWNKNKHGIYSEKTINKISEGCKGNTNAKGKRSVESILNMPRVEVVQFSLNNDLIKIFPSIIEASRQTKNSVKRIINSCKNKKQINPDFIWKYKKNIII